MPSRWPNNMDDHFNTLHPTSIKTRWRNNWPSAMESSTASSVFSPYLNRVAPSRLCSTNRFRISGRSFDPHGESVYDRFANLNWPKLLSKYAKLVTPQLQ